MEINKIYHGDALKILKTFPDESIDMCITSPPYWNLRNYESELQIGKEKTYEEYLQNLMNIFNEVKRVLKPDGSCWINIGDVYSSNNSESIKKQSLIGLPDRLKIKMIDNGWICRNEIIWHKPNAMPSSAKTRFNNDFEKMFFFTKNNDYYFETQYEEAKTKKKINNKKNNIKENNSKYINIEQEKSVRQGMSKDRGNNLVEKRPLLPTQDEFVNFIRERIKIKTLKEEIKDIKPTTMEHWFRRDKAGFSYPTIEDWNKVKYLLDDFSKEFIDMDYKMNYVEYETDDINKNLDKGRLKRSVWSINTKSFKGEHFAPFPEELIETPIKACCEENGIVLDCFMGSGTSAIVSKKLNRNFIGIDVNENYINIANKRLEEKFSN